MHNFMDHKFFVKISTSNVAWCGVLPWKQYFFEISYQFKSFSCCIGLAIIACDFKNKLLLFSYFKMGTFCVALFSFG